MALNGSRILLVFGEALTCPEVAWSLMNAGCEVTALFRKGSSSASRMVRSLGMIEVTSPEESSDGCIAELAGVLETNDFDGVMPLDDPGLFVISGLDPASCKVLGAEGLQAEIALDKRIQFEMAEESGFSVPAWTAPRCTCRGAPDAS